MAALVKSAELRLFASDGDVQEKLDAVTARMEELKADDPDLAVRIDTAGAAEKIQIIKDNLKSAAVAASDFAGATDKVTEASARFTGALQEQSDAAERLRVLQQDDTASAEALTEATTALTDASLTAAGARSDLAAAEARVAKLTKVASDEQVAAGVKTEESAGLSAEAGEHLNELALGAGVAAAGSVYMAMKWQEASTQLVTGAGQSEAGLEKVKSGMLAVSTQTATSSTEIQAGMYMIESAGFRGAQGLLVLKAAAEGAKVGNAQLGDVANVVTSALNAYHLPASAAVAVTNQLVATVASGKMHMEDLATSISNVLPIAASAHISFAQVGGALATMTAQGMTARRASMNLANMIRSLVSPSATASAEMKALGLNANDVAKNVGHEGLTGTLDILTEAILRNSKGGEALASSFDGMDAATKNLARGILAGKVTTDQLSTAEKGMSVQQAALIASFAKTAGSATGLKTTYDGAMKTMVGGATGLNVALLLSGKHAETFASNVKSVADAAKHSGSDVSGWSKITADAGFKLDQAKTSAENLSIAVGSALLPAVTAILSPLASGAAWLAENKDAAMALAAVVGGVLAVYVGVKAVAAFNAVKGAVKDVGEGMTWLGTKLGILSGEQDAQTASTEAATVATDELGVSEGIALGPILLIVAGIGLLIVAAIEIVRHWKDVKQWGLDAFHWVEHAAEDTWDWIKGHWPLLLGILTGPIGLAVGEIITHWKDVTKFFGEMWHDITKIAESIWHDVTKFFEDLWHDVSHIASDLWHDLVTGAETLWHDLVQVVTDLWDDEVRGWTNIWHGVVNIARTLWDDLVRGFKALPGLILNALSDLGSMLFGLGKSALESLWNGAKSVVGGLLGWARGIGHDIANAIGSVFGIHFSEPSEATQMIKAGVKIAQGLGTGMDMGRSYVSSAASRLSKSAGLAGSGGGGGWGGGAMAGKIQLELELTGSDSAILTALANAIRVKGGSPDIVRRKVVFA